MLHRHPMKQCRSSARGWASSPCTRFLRLEIVLALGTLGALSPPAFAAGEHKVSFVKQVAPLLKNHCFACHSGEEAEAKIAFDRYKDDAVAAGDRETWERVYDMVQNGQMPPDGEPRPDAKDIAILLKWIELEIFKVDCEAGPNPGRPTIRRLNRAEYNNSIRDLFGITFEPARDFPADDVGYGFDNIGDVLSLSPIHLEKYLDAARRIAETAIVDSASGKQDLPASHKAIITATPAKFETVESAAAKVLRPLASRVYRRPVDDAELGRLVNIVKVMTGDGAAFERGIQFAVQAMLVSPRFLFRLELGPANRPDGLRLIDEYELATRLSYFLWSSVPDDELTSLAGRGELRKQLRQQVERMLNDKKTSALVENFSGQWLHTRTLASINVDRKQFPQFSEGLKRDMKTETEMFFGSVVKDNRSILDFIDSKDAFVNERMARLYGIPGVRGDSFRRVELSTPQRGGILTQASVLTVTSNPNRTSPVKRGKWIMEQILGTPPPPPPADVEPLDESNEVVASASLRQRMESHRSKQECAVCHTKMDAIGFGFENYDAIGAWRSVDGKFPIDPSGTLPEGHTFESPAELKAILKQTPEKFCRCFAEKMLTYAVGRGIDVHDRCAVNEIVADTTKNDYRFHSLIVAIVESDPFQMIRVEEKP